MYKNIYMLRDKLWSNQYIDIIKYAQYGRVWKILYSCRSISDFFEAVNCIDANIDVGWSRETLCVWYHFDNKPAGNILIDKKYV